MTSPAIQLHLDAAQLLAKGEYSSCLQVSFEALRILREVFAESEQREDDEQMTDTTCTNSFFVEDGGSIVPGGVSLQMASLDTSSILLFDQALVMDVSNAAEKSQPRSDQRRHELLTACILYNAGLCYHAMALQQHQQDAASRLFPQALHMYHTAFSLLTDSTAEEEEEDDENADDAYTSHSSLSLLLLSLALCNNMASIHAHFFRWQEASQLLDCMSFLIQESATIPEEDEDESMTELLTFFMVSCQLFSPSAFVVAAAA